MTKTKRDATNAQKGSKVANTKKSTVPDLDDNENTVGLKLMTRAGRSDGWRNTLLKKWELMKN